MQHAVQDNIALVTMDDGKVNAFSLEAIAELHRHLDASADADALVIAGRPGVFSAGFDRNVMLGKDQAAMLELATAGARLVARIYGLPLPVVMAGTGHAIALGAILLMAGDMRVGARGEWSIGMNETAIGLTLPHWALTLAEARLDRKQLHQATLGATLYDADGALSVGYLDELTMPNLTVETAVMRAKKLTQLHPKAYQYTKENLRSKSLAIIKDAIDERARGGQ